MAKENNNRIDKAYRLHCEGHTDVEIAKILGITSSTVYRHIRACKGRRERPQIDKNANL